MIATLKRRRIAAERQAAVGERHRAALDFVGAVREAEAALEALKAANDRLYRADTPDEQSSINEMRHSRERMFRFVAAKEIVTEAPMLARLLDVRVATTQVMPFPDFVAHTSALDLSAGVSRPKEHDT